MQLRQTHIVIYLHVMLAGIVEPTHARNSQKQVVEDEHQVVKNRETD